MKSYEVVIIGSGLAGLQCARLLSERGAKILLVDRKSDLSKGIHTTGIFVRKTMEDFDFPPGTLGNPVRNVKLYSPSLRALNLSSRHDEFRVGKMAALYQSFLQDCLKAGVEFSNSTGYVSSDVLPTGSDQTIVKLEKEGKTFEVKTKVLIGADGAQSRVAKDLGLDENREFIVGVEEVWACAASDGEREQPVLHCFLNACLAPGYLAWVTCDGEEMHIGVGGYPDRFDPRRALENFKAQVAGKIVNLNKAELVEKRAGRIPVGGVLKKIACERGLLIGDASGAVSPLTAGGLDPCLRLSKMAAGVVWERLETGDPRVLLKCSGELFRARFVSRLWMRRILAGLSSQFLLEAGCALLRLPLMKKLAAYVFFGRSSFPDVKLKETTKIESFAVEVS